MLLKYSGYSKQRQCLGVNSGLNQAEFSQLKKLCKKEQCNELAELLDYLSAGQNPKISPPEYMEFFSELSRCSPVCGTFQVAGNPQAIEAIKTICAGLNLHCKITGVAVTPNWGVSELCTIDTPWGVMIL